MGGLGAGRSLAVAGPIVPQARRVLKSATPAPACNPSDPNHTTLPGVVESSRFGIVYLLLATTLPFFPTAM